MIGLLADGIGLAAALLVAQLALLPVLLLYLRYEHLGEAVGRSS